MPEVRRSQVVDQSLEASRASGHFGQARTYAYLLVFAAAVANTMFTGGARWLFVLCGTVCVLSSLARLRRRGMLPGIEAAWEVGFVVVIAVEGFLGADRYVARVGLASYELASEFIVAGFAVWMTASSIVTSSRRPRLPKSRHASSFSSERSRLFILALVVAVGVFILPAALGIAQSGRVGGVSDALAGSAVDAVLGGLLRSAQVVLPAMIGYHLVWIRRAELWPALVAASPILLLNFILGTRFVFLVSAIGLVVTLVAVDARGKITMVRLAAICLVVVVAMGLMVQFRTRGLLNSEPSELLAGLSTSSVVRGENVVGTMGDLVGYFDSNTHLFGRSNLWIAVFWVPRQIWPEKPTMLGYWFPRVDGSTGFSSGYSVSSGFGGDAYADFGFWGGLAILAAFGVGFGFLSLRIDRLIGERSAVLAFAACTYGFAFFAVRSLLYSIIVALGTLVLMLLYSRFASVASKQSQHD